MKKKILDILKKVGINNVGFCDFSVVENKLLECRAKSRLPQNAKTVIICAFPYKVKTEPPQNISRYAAVPDYHTVLQKYFDSAVQKLKNEYGQNEFEYFIDNSPIPEVFCAATAGLGVRGDNGLLITKKYGSWVFLGEIVTDLAVDCANLYSECPHCGKCKTACPKTEDCLSNISQKKRDLTLQEAELLRKNGIIWGCDICAEVCPLNRGVETDPIAEFSKEYRNGFCLGEDIAGRAYAWRGEKVIERNFKNLNS